MNTKAVVDKPNVQVESVTENNGVTTLNLKTRQAMPNGKVKDSKGQVYEYDPENGSLKKLGNAYLQKDAGGVEHTYLVPIADEPLNKKERSKAKKGLPYLTKTRTLVKNIISQ